MITTKVRDIGRAIRTSRLQLGWSQTKLAEHAQTTRKWISEIEHGKTTAEIGLVLKTLEVLRIRVRLEVPASKPAESTVHETTVKPPTASDLATVLSQHVERRSRKLRRVSSVPPRG